MDRTKQRLEHPKISIREASKFLGTADATLRNFVEIEKILVLDANGMATTEEWATAVVAHYRDRALGKESGDALMQAKLELTREQTRKLRFENDQADGLLVPMEEHVQLLSDITAAVIEQFNKAELEIPSLVALSAADKDRIAAVTTRWFRVAKEKLADAFSNEGDD